MRVIRQPRADFRCVVLPKLSKMLIKRSHWAHPGCSGDIRLPQARYAAEGVTRRLKCHNAVCYT